MRSDVTLRPLDEVLLQDLLDAAVADADPCEVMPPVAGPDGWTAERQAAFLRFHRSRSLSAESVETTFAVVVGEAVVGAARLCPREDVKHAVEAGVWIGRSHRGSGVGGAVLRHLLVLAGTDGFESLFVSTRPDNTAVHRLLAALGADPVREGDAVTAWVDLAAARWKTSRLAACGVHAPRPGHE
ncbi:GNAT family N-acetyltransferase [Streptomyces sp. NPDC101225]|uniref:GNAT family N-acetyltransferase n=1 Tax=Streptomyces sp. NPDC101225 TaxID=3366135 RepID=UPI003815105B